MLTASVVLVRSPLISATALPDPDRSARPSRTSITRDKGRAVYASVFDSSAWSSGTDWVLIHTLTVSRGQVHSTPILRTESISVLGSSAAMGPSPSVSRSTFLTAMSSGLSPFRARGAGDDRAPDGLCVEDHRANTPG